MAASADAADHRRTETVSAQTLHNLRSPIAVTLANAQLLERWVHRTEPADAELVLTRLAFMTTTGWRPVLQLDALHEADSAGADPGEPEPDP